MGPNYRNVQFIRGAARVRDLPPDAGVEVAFAGRSNAGKSSVINALTGIGSLARTSKTPGRTQQINFFRLSDDQRLVDLPGYGYARVPEAVKARWAALVDGYLRERRSLRGMVLVMDARHPFRLLDEQLIEWCVESGCPVHVLLNKSDKLKRSASRRTLEEARKRVSGAAPSVSLQLFSASTGEGREVLRERLDNWLQI